MVNTPVKYQSIPKYYVIFAHPFTDRQVFVSPPPSLSLSLYFVWIVRIRFREMFRSRRDSRSRHTYLPFATVLFVSK